MNNLSHTEWKHVSYSQHRKATLILLYVVMCKLNYSFKEIRVVHVYEILPKLYLRLSKLQLTALAIIEFEANFVSDV